MARVHVRWLHPLDGLEQQDGQQQERGQEPDLRVGQPVAPQRPGRGQDCQGRKERIEPDRPRHIHAQPEAERVQQVTRHDRQRDDRKVRAGPRALQHEPGQRARDKHAACQQPHDDQPGLSAAARGQPGQHDDGVDRQDQDGQIVRAQQQEERREIAQPVAPLRRPRVRGPAAQQEVGADQRQERRQRVHTDFAAVPEIEGVGRREQRGPQRRAGGQHAAAGQEPRQRPGRRHEQRGRGHGREAQDKVALPGQAHQPAEDQEVDERVLVERPGLRDAVVEDEVTQQQVRQR
ncbi:MAG: hypothetical protein BWY52_02814 [Chloroflexi bacterium ADurb.Bin325]|nr:MAG: hypothetical protein BWY52_02814 [Chloroflexi bacterium ADurb.Bin325]